MKRGYDPRLFLTAIFGLAEIGNPTHIFRQPSLTAGYSKYEPHQGGREMERRRRKAALARVREGK
jgi:hypothetical protein